MIAREKKSIIGYRHSRVIFTSVLFILSILIGCAPSAAELAAVDYTPLPRDDFEILLPIT